MQMEATFESNTSAQPHTGSTGPSSSAEGSAGYPAAYLSVGRAWGKTAQRDGKSSAAGCSPMSNWKREDAFDEPWDGVGERSGCGRDWW